MPLIPAAVAALTAASSALGGLAGTGLPSGPTPRAQQGGQVAMTRTPESVLASMTLEQRVGQLLMVGTPATSASSATLADITRYHVGNVMLTGRSYAGTTAPAAVARAMQDRVGPRSTRSVRLLVSTDQEGGKVQVLRGSGSSDLPSALTQGTWIPDRLRERSARWGRQLRAAGVNMNLAPVADTVPGPSAARANPPIGYYDREFGYTVTRVANHVRSFALGMSDAGVVPTVKHFPGLGRVHANTDTTSGVTDSVTTRDDDYLLPFRRAVRDGVPAVMMSTAYYSRLDRLHPAAFSPYVVGRLLRGDLGFKGVVISDDLGIAKQVAGWSPGTRALRVLQAGGDVVLTVTPSTVPAMYDALLARARSTPAFRQRVDAAALRVLRLKQARGLL